MTNIYHIDAGIRGFWNTDEQGIIFYADQNTSAYISAATPAEARVSFIAEMNERGDNGLELDDSMTVTLSGKVMDKKTVQS